jgi:peptide/nickel transport system permease protein
MGRYIIRRLLQAVPLLFIISLVLFVLMQASGDPLATLGGRQPPRAEDRERLARQWGLDKPILVQYLYWLIGNDWTLVDVNGDGTGDQPGTRLGVLRGDFGNSLVTRQPAMQVIAERIPNTLILMLTAEALILSFPCSSEFIPRCTRILSLITC